MSDLCVRVEGVGKRFLVPRTQRTTLRALRNLIRGEPLRRELWVLEDVSFAIERGTCTALVGRNGSGKTTLLRLISGILSPTTGVLDVRDTPRPLFATTVGFVKELSVADNVYLFGAIHGMSRRTLRPLHAEILRQAGIEHLVHAPLKDLSTGQVQRLALAIFAKTDDRFLVFDEVLGHVDRGWARRAERFFRDLADQGRTLLMTSHDPQFLGTYCSRAVWLDQGRVRRDGPFAEVMAEYEEALASDPDPAPADPESNGAGNGTRASVGSAQPAR